MKTIQLAGFCLGIGLVVASCSKQESPIIPNQNYKVDLSISESITPLEGEAYSKAEINAQVQRSLDEGKIFKWETVDDKTLWSAVVQTDSLVSIGYQPAYIENLEDMIHEVDVTKGDWKAVYDALTNYVLEASQRTTANPNLELKEILAFGEKPLPYFSVQLFDYETIATLRKMNVIRYVEPMGYGTEVVDARDFGCGSNNAESIPWNDYEVVSPNSKKSWNYDYMHIEEAWSHSQGDNITIGVIDTGVSPSQAKLNGQFSSDWSTGRTVEKYGFYEECWWWWCWNTGVNDDCGHGTSMSSVATAPRNDDGASVGVAYKANLISCRGTDDVLINSSNEKDGVSDSYYFLGNKNSVDIISASIGDVFWSGQVADAVNYAYNKGKLIFSAAGTSTSWTNWVGVTFPATMWQTTAVTGVTDDSNLERCNNCHSGSQVDFVAVMQRDGDADRTSLCLADSGNAPSRVGGSSVATATTAGIAALIWAQNPSMSRAQVLNIMKQNSSNYPNKDNHFGWGIVNAESSVVSAD